MHVLLLLLSLGQVGGASAKSVDEDVDRLHTEGMMLYRAGKYREALSSFEAAHARIPGANILFNIAKCHEALGDVDRAIATYEAVSKASDAKPDVVERANKRVELLRNARIRSKIEAVEDPQAQKPATVERTNAPAEAVSTTVDAGDGSWKGIAKWTTGGFAVAGLVVGGIAAGLGQSDHAKIESAKKDIDAGKPSSLTRARAEELQDSGRQKKIIGYSALGVGGVLAILSGVFFAIDGGEPNGVTVGGLATPDGAWATVNGRF